MRKIKIASFRSGAEQAQGVLPVDLPQDVIGQVQPADVPAALAGGMRGVLKVFVGGFKKAVIESVHFNLGQQVRAEEDAVRETQEELAGGIGLAAQFVRARADVDEHVGA